MMDDDTRYYGLCYGCKLFYYDNTTLFFGSSRFSFAKYLRFTSEDEDGR